MIRVQSPGLFTTVQDLGRPGYGPAGVSASGAADPTALRLGNLLLGNPPGAAALEMTLLGGTYVFPEGGIVALAGSDFRATTGSVRVEPWTATDLRPGQALTLGPTLSGARCYLCVRGGIQVKPFLGSASTHVLSGLGGLDGRPLRKGDELKFGPSTAPFRQRTISRQALDLLYPQSQVKALRVTQGPQWDWFSEGSRTSFCSSVYSVSEESNRMGLRLEGPAVPAVSGAHMITEGVSLGAIQVAAGGQPIILFVEQQTTGGYPKIANVISADLSAVGQLRPRDQIRFELIDAKTARTLFLQREELLASPKLMVE